MTVSLRSKLLLAVALALVFSLATQAFICFNWTLPALEQMANNANKADLLRLEEAFSQQIETLRSISLDNAVWDKMYRAAIDRDNEWFEETYFLHETFSQLNINGWYFYAHDHRLIAGQSIELPYKVTSNPIFATPGHSITQHFLFDAVAVNKKAMSRWGFVTINERPAIVLSHAITSGDASGTIAGTSLIWSYINDKRISQLSLALQKPLSLIPVLSAADIPVNVVPAYTPSSLHGEANNRQLNLLFNNYLGRAFFILRFNETRYPFDSRVFDQTLLVGLLAATLMLYLFYLFIRHQILVPLGKMVDIVAEVMDTSDFSKRIDLKGYDAIGRLGNHIDNLFALVKYQKAELVEHNKQLRNMSYTAPLTGIANRRYLDQHLQTLAESDDTTRMPLSLLLIDVDHFKSFNDNYGHNQGDKALVDVATILRQNTHAATDFVCRLGGEEFVIVLRDTEYDDALAVAENLCTQIASAGISHVMSPYHVLTVSIGVATKAPGVSLHHAELIDQADKAMYLAKDAGRNRFEGYLSDT